MEKIVETLVMTPGADIQEVRTERQSIRMGITGFRRAHRRYMIGSMVNDMHTSWFNLGIGLQQINPCGMRNSDDGIGRKDASSLGLHITLNG
jgi:hypothetical protein